MRRVKSAITKPLENFNPFNPYDGYQRYVTSRNENNTSNAPTQSEVRPKSSLRQGSLNQNTHMQGMVRNLEKRGLKQEEQFQKYINKLTTSEKKSIELLKQSKQKLENTSKEMQQMHWKKSKKQLFLEYLVEQERKMKHAGTEEQLEFMKFREKQMRVLQIKSFVQKTRQIRLQHEIDEILSDIPDAHNSMLSGGSSQISLKTRGKKKTQIKYLINEKIKSPHHLDKPILFGVTSSEHKKHFQHHLQGGKIPLPLDFINLGLTHEQKKIIIQRLYGKGSSFKQTVIIKDNENYRELAEGIQHELTSPRDVEGQAINESGELKDYHDSIRTVNLNI